MSKFNRRDVLAYAGATAVAALFGPAAAFAQVKIPAPKPGQGVVVFYRSGTTAGSGVRFTIQDANGRTVAHLKRGSVDAVPVPAGPNFFKVPEANNTEGTIDVKAGQTLYIRCYLNAATFAGKLQFEEVSEERARKELKF
ncbi:hypothetical protein SAMN05444000_10346 [Shimia gijangensis]|uniref:Tat (Twin-arginine translocation) pathway signal sequence n=1 Tax=Shimia gijangensis TaxID=1470563 RepID=A0A1M6DYH3_9RHOB|nr:hypothetical protein [Shimia gijangensis]SHI78195.1 hypothetical protein SAMN05444000_10346 [Shimia gijangensis]